MQDVGRRVRSARWQRRHRYAGAAATVVALVLVSMPAARAATVPPAAANPSILSPDIRPALLAKTWHHRDLTAQTGTPTIEGDVVTFAVAGTDSRVYFPGDDNHIHELAYYQGGWHHRDLTVTTGAPTSGRGRLAGFAMNGMNPRLYYEDFYDHVHELAYTGTSWQHRDLTASTGAPAMSISSIAAFQASGTDPRVYYRTYTDNHIRELAHWQGAWHHRDITADIGAPVSACCRLVAFTAGGPDSRVYYQDSPGHVHELSYWQSAWHHRDITADIGAPVSEVNVLAGFTVGGADSRIYYEDPSEHVHELSYWQRAWHHRDLSRAVDASQPGTSGLAGFPMGNGGDARVYSMNWWEGHVHEYAFYQGGWHLADISDAAGAPDWGGGGMVAAFLAAGTDSRVYYNDNGHLRELAYYDDAPGPSIRTVSLQRQMVWEGFIPYLGRFPAFGVVPPGRLLKIRIPQIGPVDLTVYFVKAGRSTTECNNPNAVVPLNEGQSTTPTQINAIFGQTEPRFSTTAPLTFVACIGINSGEAPDWRNIEITVQFD
jgi:hypothetical protein